MPVSGGGFEHSYDSQTLIADNGFFDQANVQACVRTTAATGDQPLTH